MNLLVAADVFFYDRPGGGARVPWEIARGFARRGHQVFYLVRQWEPARDNEILEGVQIIRFGSRRQSLIAALLSGMAAVRRLKERIDLYHLHQPLPALAVLLGTRFKAIPRIYFFHSPWNKEFLIREEFRGGVGLVSRAKATLRRFIEHFVISRAQLVLMFSKFMQCELGQVHSYPSSKSILLNGAVDTGRFHPNESQARSRELLNWPGDSTVMLTVRNLEPRMGIENLLSAMAMMDQQDLILYVVGRGSMREILESQARDLGIDPAVHFLGYVPDDELPVMYRAADLFVLPTRALEGFGLVTVEALACGCPVIGTPIGATPEILEGLEPDWLAKGAEAEDLADAVQRFLDLRCRWPYFRRKCSEYAVRNYSWTEVVDRIEAESTTLAAK